MFKRWLILLGIISTVCFLAIQFWAQKAIDNSVLSMASACAENESSIDCVTYTKHANDIDMFTGILIYVLFGSIAIFIVSLIIKWLIGGSKIKNV